MARPYRGPADLGGAMTRALLSLLAGLVALPALALEPRIVSAGGTATEILYALGAQGGLVGVDTTSLYPAAAQGHTSIGYVRNLSAEGVVSLNPTLVIAAAEAGPPPILAQIKAAGIPVLPLVDGYTEDAVLTRIGQIGAAIGKKPEAAKLQDSVRRDLAAVRQALGGIKERPKVLFVLSAARGLVVAGDDTSAGTMIALAGGQNAVTGFTGYKPLTPEALLAAAPNVILTASHVVAALGSLDALTQHPNLTLTPAVKEGRIIVRDALFLLGFGPRLGSAVLDLARALHPNAGLPKLAALP